MHLSVFMPFIVAYILPMVALLRLQSQQHTIVHVTALPPFFCVLYAQLHNTTVLNDYLPIDLLFLSTDLLSCQSFSNAHDLLYCWWVSFSLLTTRWHYSHWTSSSCGLLCPGGWIDDWMAFILLGLGFGVVVPRPTARRAGVFRFRIWDLPALGSLSLTGSFLFALHCKAQTGRPHARRWLGGTGRDSALNGRARAVRHHVRGFLDKSALPLFWRYDLSCRPQLTLITIVQSISACLTGYKFTHIPYNHSDAVVGRFL